MDFGLKINPGVDARKFLDSKVESLRGMTAQEGLAKLKEDIPLIFEGRFDKLIKDSRFKQVFLEQRPNLRLEKATYGEIFIGAFTFLDSVFNERMSLAADAEERKAIEQEYFKTKLEALENIFAGNISIFDHYFVLIFLRYTFQQKRFEGEELETIKNRFREFIEEEKTLLRFFFYLDYFNNYNAERRKLDQNKKSSLSQRLDDEISQGEPSSSLRRQILICDILKYLAAKLIETSQDHKPLDEVRRILDEVYVSEGEENVIKGLLEKFRSYYDFEMNNLHESLVYKQIIAMNSGVKSGRENRKKWIEDMDFDKVNRLVSLLEIKDANNQRLSQEQKAQLEAYHAFREKLDQVSGKDDAKSRNPLEEGDMNLLIHRLSNVTLLEEQISREEEKIEAYRKSNNVVYQDNIIRTYNDGISRLTQSLYFFLELSAFLKTRLEIQAKRIFEEVKTEIEAFERQLKGEPAEELKKKPEEEEKEKPEEEGKEAAEAAGPEKEAPQVPKSSADEKDPAKRTVLLAQELKKAPDPVKMKSLKELAYTGEMDSLKYILPLSQYSSVFLRNVARNTVIKIVLRILKENEEKPVLGLQQKKKFVDLVIGLDKKYNYLKEMELASPKTMQKIFDILIHEDADFTARTLSQIITDEDSRVRATAVKMIADMLNQKESGLLMKLLNDPDARVRANVIESLEAVGNRNVLGILMKYKYDKDNRVRANTIKAIWKFGHQDIEDVLQEMLLDIEPKMRASGIWVIGEIGYNQPKIKALLKAVQNDQNEMVKANLDKAMNKIDKREKGQQVVVADDDLGFCQDVCRKLVRDGFKATAALNGRAAITSMEKIKPDILFLDLRMPVMNGLEVLKILREKEETRNIPVIVMSDLNSSVLLKQVGKAGANDFLLKPCSYEQIKEKIQNYI